MSQLNNHTNTINFNVLYVSIVKQRLKKGHIIQCRTKNNIKIK